MKTFIKWAGGKEKELPFILSNLPKQFDRYIEPFVGGGAVYFNINFEKSVINDKSEELVLLYKMIQENNQKFIRSLNYINKNWIELSDLVNSNSMELKYIYINCRIDSSKLEHLVLRFIDNHRAEIDTLFKLEYNIKIYDATTELKKNLVFKIKRMLRIEKIKNELSEEDILSNIETAFKSTYYIYLRNLYNDLNKKAKHNTTFYCALFYFLREYCYSAMFRYNANGEFNVPYGGISYNKKDFSKKIDYLASKELQTYLSDTKIYGLDFEIFLDTLKLNEKDFIFLDPPYDTEFSTYAKNDFDQEDQRRLANYLKNTKAKFMLVIKNTEFISELYKDSGLNITTFEKRYLVSFMNRNEKEVKHLMIRNYRIFKLMKQNLYSRYNVQNKESLSKCLLSSKIKLR